MRYFRRGMTALVMHPSRGRRQAATASPELLVWGSSDTLELAKRIRRARARRRRVILACLSSSAPEMPRNKRPLGRAGGLGSSAGIISGSHIYVMSAAQQWRLVSRMCASLLGIASFRHDDLQKPRAWH